MAIINRLRTISPNGKPSTSYKINVEKVSECDTLIVTIDYKNRNAKNFYRFYGRKLKGRKYIHFNTDAVGIVSWCEIIPEEI